MLSFYFLVVVLIAITGYRFSLFPSKEMREKRESTMCFVLDPD